MKVILVGLLVGLLSVPAMANNYEKNVNSKNETRAQLFKGINKLCDSFEKGPGRVYCQDAQFYGYQRFSRMAFDAKNNEKLEAILMECVEKFRFDKKMIDYGMAIRCISFNVDDKNIKILSSKTLRN